MFSGYLPLLVRIAGVSVALIAFGCLSLLLRAVAGVAVHSTQVATTVCERGSSGTEDFL